MITLRKPILVVGIGLSLLLWLGESFHSQITTMGQWGVILLIIMGTSMWWLQKEAKPLKIKPLPPLKREIVETAIAKTQTFLDILTKEAPNLDLTDFKEALRALPTFERDNLQIAITGAKSTGKSSLKRLIQAKFNPDTVTYLDTPALFDNDDENALQTALNSDLVIFIVTGDLTASGWHFIQELHHNYQRVLLLFNKQDQYVLEERTVILEQLRQRVKEIIPEENLISVSIAPSPVKIKRYIDHNTVEESLEVLTPNIESLSQRLETLLTEEKEYLVWGSIYRSAIQLQQQIKANINEIRRNKAIPLIESYQWLAAATALANPVAALDLLATAAINAQMLLDLSQIYQQPFSLSQAQVTSGEMGKLMVKLGLVELSTQTIGSLLKSNAITYLAGGAIQGVSAAYSTRIAGLSLIAYFQEQEIGQKSENKLNLEQLGTKIQQIFQENQRTAFLKGFVKQAINSGFVS